ncbi:MAG: efflux RND transporter permease subunit [Pseudomonadales bacterium]|nr:efflux RND transporter permease subunit [Pseudomonadales bacterium]
MIASFTVHRPVLTTMVTLIAIVVGIISLTRLPVDAMPEINFPTLTISTVYDNTGPEEIEELITERIESAVATVNGVEEVISISTENVSTVRVQFEWDVDLDVASNDLRDRLDRIRDNLPEDAGRPELRKFDTSSFPVVILGIASDLDPFTVRDLIEDQIAYRVERLDGVASLDLWGGLNREIQVLIDPKKLRILGISLQQVANSLRAANLNAPAGEIEQGDFELRIRTPGRFKNLDDIRNLELTHSGDFPIYLSQVAEVRDTHEKIKRIVRINGQPGFRLSISKQSGSNTVDVAKIAMAEVDRINRDYPQIELIPIINTADFIEQAVSNLARSAMYGGGLALLVLLFFLRNLRGTLVVATVIPVSLISTFALIYFGGLTLNQISLGGLALGIGMMVDNAIVVVENIVRVRDEDQLEIQEASIIGTHQVSAAIIASTLTTMAIFFPLVFTDGVASIIFKELAMVLSFALLCSLLAALTLTPMLTSRWVKGMGSPSEVKKPGLSAALSNWAASILNRVEQTYQQHLKTALQHPVWVLIATTVVLFGSFALVPGIGTEFMPRSDQSELRINVEMAPGTRLDKLDQVMVHVEEIVKSQVSEMKSSVVSIGSSSWRPSGGASGSIRLSLVPVRERQRSSEEIAAELRTHLTNIPGTTIRIRASQGFFGGSSGGGATEALQVEIRGRDLVVLDSLASQLQVAMEQLEGVTDAQSSRESGTPEKRFHINRERAADLDVSVQSIVNGLETALAGRLAGKYRGSSDEINIRLKLEGVELLTTEDILDLTLLNKYNRPVQLRNLVSVSEGTGPLHIDRKGQQRIVTVAANTSGRALGNIVTDLNVAIANIPMPRGYDMVIAGDHEEQSESFSQLLLALILAVFLVYMIMASLYESLRDPLVVMFTLPLAIIGVLITLFITSTTFNVQSFIGVIMLIGIVINNAILIVDQATRLLLELNTTPAKAVLEAGRRRLRPILMTSLTTILAMLPLALGVGEGSEMQAPMAITLIGGLISSTLITLVVIPCLYVLFHRKHKLGPLHESHFPPKRR